MQQETIYLFARWQVRQGQLDTVMSLAKELKERSLSESGNLQYGIFQSHDDDHSLLLFEAYINKEALDAHRNSMHFQQIVLQQIVPLLENRDLTFASSL